jgi:hypothetical protein
MLATDSFHADCTVTLQRLYWLEVGVGSLVTVAKIGGLRVSERPNGRDGGSDTSASTLRRPTSQMPPAP